MAARIESVFREAGCKGQVCVQTLDGSREVALDADRLVVSAVSVRDLVVSMLTISDNPATDALLDLVGVWPRS